jgi:hypothetical protein
LGLWPAPDSLENPKMSNSDHDGAPSIRNFVLMMMQMIKISFEPLSLEACVALRQVKIETSNIGIMALYRSGT